MALLEVENLKVGFPAEEGVFWAVSGVSFGVQTGETLAIVGESGSGKTTLCRSLMRLCPGNCLLEGSIRLKGRELCRLKEEQMRKVRGAEMAYLFQESCTALDPAFPIGAQIAEAACAHEKMGKKEARRRAEQLLCLVRLGEGVYPKYPHELSGGMLQRAALAAALACRPALLIADEPTAALDSAVQVEILRLLREIKREFHMAMLLITHDLGVAAQLADRMAVMRAGRLVEEGRAEEVLHQPQHPYTWALLAAQPGARAVRREGKGPESAALTLRRALARERQEQPPAFFVSKTHWAATWLLQPGSPKIAPPVYVREGSVWIEEEFCIAQPDF